MASSLIPYVAAILCGVATALAFPKTNLTILAPLGAAGLFATWYGLTPIAAFRNGWLAGFVFFTVTWYWIGDTAGTYVAPFGFLLVLIPSFLHGIAFGAAGALSAYAYARAPRNLAPLAAAAAFTLCEWLRSFGILAAPLSDLAYTQVDSPLAPIASYVGAVGLTFTICVIGAYLAYAFHTPPVGGALRTLGVVAGSIVLCTAVAWIFWPARTLSKPNYSVAVAQGDISQNIKWTQAAFDLSLDRYESLTEQAATYGPAFVLWPETVVPTNLNVFPAIQRRLSRLARSTQAELIVGSRQLRDGKLYNALYFFRPDGTLDAVYRKRKLVPFAEELPFADVLGKLPGADLIGRYSEGDSSGVVDVSGARIAPLICWESVFGDLALEGVRDGAQAFVVATDDAWFGTTAGPYQHAQIAQMRALETGSWIVRAGATGISGVIAPNGRYTAQSKLNEITVVHGFIGPRAGSLFSLIGSTPITLALTLLYVALVSRRQAA